MLLLLALACFDGTADLAVGERVRRPLGTDTAEDDTGLDTGDTSIDTADTGVDSGDTAVTDSGDTSIDTGDTSTTDSGDADTDTDADSDSDSDADSDTDSDTDTSSPCTTGITSIDPASYTVDSMDAYVEITITLNGCATGVSVPDGGFISGGYAGSDGTWVGGYRYTGTWTDVPTSFDGSATATIEYTGSTASIEGEMWFYFTSDQGDNDLFTLFVTP